MTEGEEFGGLILPSVLWAFISGTMGVAAYIAFKVATLSGAALPAAAFVGVFTLVSRAYWNFRTEPWFWLCSGCSLVLHAGLVLLLNIPRGNFPAIILVVPLVALDFFASIAAYWFVKGKF